MQSLPLRSWLCFIICQLLFCSSLTLPCKADYIQGGIEHSDYLPQIPQNLSPGTPFKEGLLKYDQSQPVLSGEVADSALKGTVQNQNNANLQMQNGQFAPNNLQGNITQNAARLQNQNLTPRLDRRGQPIPANINRLSAGSQNYSPDLWIRIPNWMAGSWLRKEQIRSSHRDFQNWYLSPNVPPAKRQQALTHLQFGMQEDRFGGIWHYIGDPVVVRGDGTRVIYFHKLRITGFQNEKDRYCILRLFSVRTRVGKKTNRIEAADQQEELQRIDPINFNLIKVNVSVQGYLANGRRAGHEIYAGWFLFREKPFQIIDQFQGKDMRLSFRNYLAAKGWSNLIPDRLLSLD